MWTLFPSVPHFSSSQALFVGRKRKGREEKMKRGSSSLLQGCRLSREDKKNKRREKKIKKISKKPLSLSYDVGEQYENV